MGNLILLPGVVLTPPTRQELVDEASELIMKDIMCVFVEQEYEPGPIQIWHREVRDFFWSEEINLVDNDFVMSDVRKWKAYWREKALRYIGYSRSKN